MADTRNADWVLRGLVSLILMHLNSNPWLEIAWALLAIVAFAIAMKERNESHPRT